jgi:two-component system, NarL family, response regulator LiaR
MMPSSIVIVEDNETFANALIQLIGKSSDFLFLKHFSTAYDAVETLPEYGADICILDYQMPKMTGVELLKLVKAKCPTTLFVMCSTFEDEQVIFSALKNGAVGYFSKLDSPSSILDSLKLFLNGGAPMSANIANKVIHHFNAWQKKETTKLEQLTKREMELLVLLAEGKLYKEIADELHISIDTVKGTCSRIYRKLEVNNKVEAINLLT